jgi:hypothetical protein
LRRAGDKWQVVGEAYIHGVMMGEVLEHGGDFDRILLH